MTITNVVEIQYYSTIVGELILGSYEQKLCLLDYVNRKNRETIDKRIQKYSNAVYVIRTNAVLEKTKKQITEFLNNERRHFNIPFVMMGTEFQQTVWKALLEVPYGNSTSYLQLAKNINNEKAVRAVASANGANAMSLLIPCHRVIGNDGSLVGYAGGLAAKKHLLSLEIL